MILQQVTKSISDSDNGKSTSASIPSSNDSSSEAYLLSVVWCTRSALIAKSALWNCCWLDELSIAFLLEESLPPFTDFLIFQIFYGFQAHLLFQVSKLTLALAYSCFSSNSS